MFDRIRGALSLAVCFSATLHAEEPTPTVVARLKHPTAVVAAPGGEIFVVDSVAGKLIRFKDDKPTDVVTGYTVASSKLGPLSVAVLPGDAILLGDGAESADGLIRVFPWFKNSAHDRQDAKDKIGPLKVASPFKDNGIIGIATTPEAVFAVCHHGKTPRGLARSLMNGTKFGPLERWAEGDENDTFNPTAMVIHPQEGHVVVARQNIAGESGAVKLTMYSRQSAKPLLDLPLLLDDVNSLAYSPKTGRLYAAEFSRGDKEAGGLFRLDATFGDEGQAIQAVRITSLDRPTSLAFAEDGSLWVTLLGKSGEDRGGSLVKFKPGL